MIRVSTLMDMLRLEHAARSTFASLSSDERAAYVLAHPDTTIGAGSPEHAACWKHYRQIGVKEKDGRTVPNCVPRKKKKGKT